jgi:sigma-B regulation protein RsbU (phosphoserine phosphatase)
MDSAQMELAPVAPVFDSLIHEQLIERRERLKSVEAIAGTEFGFAGLLNEVDAALRKFENGRFGECEVCHDAVEAERLLADPLMKVCLGCLTDKQRASLEDDLQLAFDIQQGLLPKVGVKCDKWRVHHAYQPAGIVSGDYVDIIEREDEFYFLLGDVSGKGMAASLLMSNLHAMFHSLVPMDLPLEDLMTRANRLLNESSLANQYATLVCGKANRAGEVEISNAGHLSPILVKNGVKGELNSAGLPLGMFNDAEFKVNRVQLDGGDSIVLYSDGVTETLNGDGREFGTEGLFGAINGGPIDGPEDLINRCLGRVTEYRGNSQPTDDLTMLAVAYV